jgi:LuxR family maltose regulon positive regulatory protein
VADACAAWTQVLECEISVELYGQAVETRLRLASALAEAHRLDDSARVLRPVLARLQDSAEFGMAATAGQRALEQLAGARWSALFNADEQALLRRWLAAAQALHSHLPTATASSALSTPSATQLQITPREFEVLQRIAAGDSNKLIARAFDLSPHTVKRHVANILDKLGVATRGQAAAWARDHA